MPLFYSLEIHVFLKGLTHWPFIYLVQLMNSKHILPYSVMVSPALLSIRQNWWYYHLSFTFSRLQTAIWCCGMAKENPFLHKNRVGVFFDGASMITSQSWTTSWEMFSFIWRKFMVCSCVSESKPQFCSIVLISSRGIFSTVLRIYSATVSSMMKPLEKLKR